MKRIGIVLFFLLIGNIGICQTATFSKIYGDSTLLYAGTSIISFKDTIYFSTTEQDIAHSYQAANFIKIEARGNIIQSSRFNKPGYYFYPGDPGSLKITSDGYLICGGNEGPLIFNHTNDQGSLFKFDRVTLDTLYLKHYQQGNISGFTCVDELSDSGYLLSGGRGDTSITNNWLWLLKTDKQGNEIWRKSLSSDQYNYGYGASSFLGGFYEGWGTSNNGSVGDSAIFLDKYSNSGNLLWRDTFGVIGNDNVKGPYSKLKDGGLIQTINLIDTSDNQEGPIVIYKLDSLGRTIWRHYVSMQTQFSSIIETKSHNVVLGGWGGGYPVGISGDTSRRLGGGLIKFDENGNLLFYQVYEYDTTEFDAFIDLTETDDGGYASVGVAFETIGNINYQRAWLLKVDSNGCLNGDCPTLATGINTVIDPVSFFVFPNPATSHFTVALAGPQDIYRYTDLKFTLYDLTGLLVCSRPITEQTTIIQRGDLSNGLYLWELSDASGKIDNGKVSLK